MKQIQVVFTAIPKKCRLRHSMDFHSRYYGWVFDENNDPCDYFYTVIYTVSRSKRDAKERLDKFISILKSSNVTYSPAKAKMRRSSYDPGVYYLEDGNIDHSYELASFVDDLLDNPDKLLRFLSAGLVYTGNDNDSEHDGFLERDKEYLERYDLDKHQYVPSDVKNEYYMKNYDDYEWYMKGN